MIIKLSDGEVLMKDALTRKERREISARINSGLEARIDDGKTYFPIGSMTNAQNEAIFSAIEHIKIKGELKPLTHATLDNEEWITDEEFKKIEEAANALLSPAKFQETLKKKQMLRSGQ